MPVHPARGARRRVPRPALAAALVVAVLLLLVAVQLVVGRLPVLGALLPGSDPLTVEDTTAPKLDCDGGSSGGVVAEPGEPGRDLRVLAEAERDSDPQRDLLVTVSAHRDVGGVVVVWRDAATRPRLVASYTSTSDGYYLSSRSTCAR